VEDVENEDMEDVEMEPAAARSLSRKRARSPSASADEDDEKEEEEAAPSLQPQERGRFAQEERSAPSLAAASSRYDPQDDEAKDDEAKDDEAEDDEGYDASGESSDSDSDSDAKVDPDEQAGLRTDWETAVRAPSPLLEALDLAGMPSLRTAGNATNATFATVRRFARPTRNRSFSSRAEERASDRAQAFAGRIRVGARASTAQDASWSSGAASRTDGLVPGARANHVDGTFHAEEKVVKSVQWRDQTRELVNWVRAPGRSGEIWLAINRSSCTACTGSLIEAKQEIDALVASARVDPELITCNLTVLGEYRDARPEDLIALQDAGWRVQVHPAESGYTRVGLRQVGAILGMRD
jgi:hypothetical protein